MSDTIDKPTLEDHLRPAQVASSDPEYLAFKARKIKTGIEQAKDRSNMIPANKVWEDFGFER